MSLALLPAPTLDGPSILCPNVSFTKYTRYSCERWKMGAPTKLKLTLIVIVAGAFAHATSWPLGLATLLWDPGRSQVQVKAFVALFARTAPFGAGGSQRASDIGGEAQGTSANLEKAVNASYKRWVEMAWCLASPLLLGWGIQSFLAGQTASSSPTFPWRS